MSDPTAGERRRLEVVARLMRTAREGQGISLRKIAKEACVPPTVVSNIERGTPGYTIGNVESVVEALRRLTPPAALDRVMAKIAVDPVRGEEPREAAGTIGASVRDPAAATTEPNGELRHGSGKIKL